MDVTRTQGSDSPPGVSYGRTRWPQHAEVSVLRRLGRREGYEESTRQIENRGVDVLPFGSRTTVIYCSNAHLVATSPDVPASPQGEVFRWANRKLKAGPLSLLLLMR